MPSFGMHFLSPGLIISPVTIRQLSYDPQQKKKEKKKDEKETKEELSSGCARLQLLQSEDGVTSPGRELMSSVLLSRV